MHINAINDVAVTAESADVKRAVRPGALAPADANLRQHFHRIIIAPAQRGRPLHLVRLHLAVAVFVTPQVVIAFVSLEKSG